MLIYLLKFSACLAIFLLFYKLVLERESMHAIKRYFLLSAILLSLGIPFVTFIEYVEPVVLNETVVFSNQMNYSIVEEAEATIDYLPMILWSLYGLGVLFFSIKFIFNLTRIFLKINRNPKQKNKSFIYVLLNDLIVPHTFFNYIFLNKNRHENHAIPKEVFWHEQAHASQKHSLDILFIELIQIIFWFNPLIYFAKASIKMNHEFLADEAVLRHGIEPSIYQKILLTFSSNVAEPNLANAINYSSIKKRFTVMKTHTSKQKIWLRSFLLLPLLGILLFSFAEREQIIKEINTSSSNSKLLIGEDINILIETDNQFTINDKKTSTEDFKSTLYQFNSKLSFAERKKVVHIYITSEYPQVTQESIKKFIEVNRILHIYGFKEMKLDTTSLNVPEKILDSLNSQIYVDSPQQIDVGMTEEGLEPILEISFNPNVFKLNGKETSLSQLKEDFIKETNNEKSDLRIKTQGGIKMSLITEIMDKLKENLKKIRLDEAAYIIGDPATNEYQQKATPEEVAEYNKLAKYCNSQLESEHPIIKTKDISRIAELYVKMSVEQKKNAEPFPNFPPPPPPPAPETGFIEVNNEILWYVKYNPIKYYNKKGYLVDKNGKVLNGNKQVNASDVLPGQYITKIYKDDKVVVEFKENGVENMPPPPPPPPAPDAPKTGNKKNVPSPTFPDAPRDKNGNILPPPPPPPAYPKSNLEFMQEMVDKGALFFYEGKSISSDKAIDITTKIKDLNFSIKQIDSKEPKVYIWKGQIKVPGNKKLEASNQMDSATTYMKIDADTFEDLKQIDWKSIIEIFSENKPDTMVTVEFNYNNPILFEGSKIDTFNHKIHCKTSELEIYLNKSKKIISKLKPLK